MQAVLAILCLDDREGYSRPSRADFRTYSAGARSAPMLGAIMTDLPTSRPTAAIAPRIVAIGASAGGITALQKLCETLPLDIPFAIVVLQHLPPANSSMLPTLISRWTAIPVRIATDGSRPDTNCIYIPSPEHILTLEHGVFRTRAADGGGRRPGIDSIDAFLESVARCPGPFPIAVILSGTGMDGTAGAVRIRQADGVVIVQDPLTALHDSMPNAVIQRGIHDHILPVSAIAQQILMCIEPEYKRPSTSIDWPNDVSKTLDRIICSIRRQSGFDLSGYKPSPLFWRIQQRMDARRVWTFADYSSLIEDDPIELETLSRSLPIHVTEFFRDHDAWIVLKRDVLPDLFHAAKKFQPIRAWSAACSTGEEAYSIAMLLDEVSQESNGQADYTVFATDVAPEILARAGRGLFHESSLAGVSLARRAAYFYAVDQQFRIKRPLRERMVFAPHNLMLDPPFGGVDFVTCRNLLIYLEREKVDHVLAALFSSLRIGGYLFLGKGESYHLNNLGFEVISPKWNIFRKTSLHFGTSIARLPTRPTPTTANLAAGEQRIALEQAGLPSALIDEAGSILRLYGNTAGILSLPAGEPTHNIFQLVSRNSSLRLKIAVQQAFSDHEPMNLIDLDRRPQDPASVGVRLTPLQNPAGAWNRMFITFLPEEGILDKPQAPDAPSGEPDGQYYPEASERWRDDDARITREELAASREELQALNEELRASNSQLNASNEELNESNYQLREKIDQLNMQNRVLFSGEVMTLFLDGDLRIRWFTPAMQSVFKLAHADIGRKISDLVSIFDDPAFYPDIQDVLHATESREIVVASRDPKKYFSRRIHPYQSVPGRITGVAVTFSDVTDRTIIELKLRQREIWLNAQMSAFELAMTNAPIEHSLGLLISALVDGTEDDRRCAFYIAQGDGLRHVVGMPDEYAKCVNGFLIAEESLACGLAVATGKSVITRDIMIEPRWKPWIWLAKRFGYRGCWSFPVMETGGTPLGSLAMYFAEPREPTPIDLELASLFTKTAAIIIARHQQTRLQ